MILKLFQNQLQGFKKQISGAHRLRICISKNFPGNADATDWVALRTTDLKYPWITLGMLRRFILVPKYDSLHIQWNIRASALANVDSALE